MKGEKNNIIVGLDIGTTKICAIVGQLAENGKINILGIGKSSSQGGVSRGMVANVSKVVQAIQEAVEQAEKVSQVKINTAYVGIAGHHIKSLQHRGTLNRHNGDDEIKKEELMRLEQEMENLVLQPGLDILHVIPQDYTIDGEEGIRDPEGRIGVRVECNYHIITGETSRAKIIGRAVKNAHLEVADLIVEPVASATAVLSQDEMEAGVVLVDIGGGTTDICIFENGFISHTAIIPIGGDRITMDLQEAFGILKIQAEEVKVLYGSCFPTEQMKNEVVVIPGLPGREPKEISVYAISQVIRARMEDIINKVEFEIVLSGVNNTLNGGIVLTGGGSSLKEVKQLFSFETGFDVHIGTPGQHLGRGQVEEVRKPLYATAIGLVMKGIEIEHAYGSQFAPNQLMDSQQSQRDVNEPELEIVDDSQTPPQKQQKQKGPSWKSTYNMSMFSDLLRQWFSDEEENDFK
jgi:cell division protein FtsA